MSRGQRFRRIVVACVALGALAWIGLFDSHSLVNRVKWSREVDRLTAENAALAAQMADLEDQIEHADAPEVVERVAREQYGMRRPGETVYRLDAPPAPAATVASPFAR